MIDETIQLEGLTQKLNGYIERHGPNARNSVRQLIERGQISQDNLVPMHELLFSEQHGKLVCAFGDLMKGVGAVCSVHDNAVRQVAERVGIPSSYAVNMANAFMSEDQWKPKIMSKLLGAHIEHAANDRVLVRRVGDEIRAVLSDRYRRLNMPGIFGAFGERAQRHGAVLADGHCGPLRSHLEVVLPKVHPVTTKNNGVLYMVFGIHISSSDYGAGALDVKRFNMSMVCTNRMIGRSYKRMVHLGSRLDPQDFAFSDETYRKDYETIKSAVVDIVDAALSPISIEREIANMQHDSEIEVNIEKRIENLPKLGMTKDEAKDIESILLAGRPEDGLYGAPTLLKFKQAVSAYARDLEPERSREIQVIAGNITH